MPYRLVELLLVKLSVFAGNHGQVRDAQHGYLTRCAVVGCEEAVALLVREQESKGKPSYVILRRRASSHPHPLMPANATFKLELVVVIMEEAHCHDQRRNVRSILFRHWGQLKMAL